MNTESTKAMFEATGRHVLRPRAFALPQYGSFVHTTTHRSPHHLV